MMNHNDIPIRAAGRSPVPGELDPSKLGFGKKFTPRMFQSWFRGDDGWQDPAVVKYETIPFDPAALVFHYAQATFEGLKAYPYPNGEVGLFRPAENARRLNRSNQRLCIPEIPVELFLAGTDALVDAEREWVPHGDGTSLYIRPVVIATEPALGVRVSSEYLFLIILSPAGPYFGSFDPVRISVVTDYVRAAPGGTGAAKAAGNYSASLLPGQIAKKAGYAQTLYLDAVNRRFVEELGGMNVFIVDQDTIVTPPASGTILPGITRNSILKLAKHRGLTVEERPIDVEDLLEGIDTGRVTEVFASGTAAVVTPIGVLGYGGFDHTVGDGATGTMTKSLYEEITDIQYGRCKDPFDWVRTVPHRG